MRATTSLLLPLLLLPALALTVPGDTGPYPTDYFRSPLGIPILLSGNFAEMRDSHFHGGLDMKTRESEGYRVYAAADGYIERAKVSPSGYGNALYLAHPNGYTTVYAHLSRFKGEIASHVRSRQYARQSFAIDEYLEADRFPVKKGQVIALSGNSGSSSGPHLHFEIRTSRDQVPVNPLLFGFDVEDSRTPRIFRVRMYPIGSDSGILTTGISGKGSTSEPVTVEVESAEGGYRLNTPGVVTAWGRIAFGIQTHDYHNGSRSRLGAYRITLSIDDSEYHVSTMERISFDDTRYINAHIDYAERKSNRRWIQRSHRLPGNRLPIYQHVNDGIVRLAAGDTIKVHYQVEDAYGNMAELAFPVAGIRPPAGVGGSDRDADARQMLVRYNEPSVVSREDFRAEMPANALYEDAYITYTSGDGPPGAYSQLHVLHDPLTPVHQRYRLSIRANRLPARLEPKALVATLDDDGDVSSAGGSYADGFVTTRVRAFDRYFVTVDTTAPTIASLDLKPDGQLGRRSRLRFRSKDDLTGVSTYSAHLDGAWSLLEFDAKRNMLILDIDPSLSPGRHELTVEVADEKDNTTKLTIPFTR